MTEDQERRLSGLESTVATIRVRQAEIAARVETTVDAVAAVKSDTESIVQALKGASLIGRVSKWIAAVFGAILIGKGLKWW